jgi:hypothetical protein
MDLPKQALVWTDTWIEFELMSNDTIRLSESK